MSVFIHGAYFNNKRFELLDWFKRNAPGLGKLYEGALYMVYTNGYPGRLRFVAHAIREIRNRLPDVIAGPKDGGPLQYKNRLDEITEVWKRCGLPIGRSLPVEVTEGDELPSSIEISMPIDLYQKIAELIHDHEKSREKPYEAAKRLFQAIDSRNRESEGLLRPRIEHWINITNWFMNYVHKWNLDDDEIDAVNLRRRFQTFETTLIALLTGFFRTTEELDEILEKANS
ncbi:MAG: hypothetical protein JRJ29_22775 [Deltaproteobacteria bacterium]|nr:hypothetical protein [Deltaproteobacteria bacterium]